MHECFYVVANVGMISWIGSTNATISSIEIAIYLRVNSVEVRHVVPMFG